MGKADWVGRLEKRWNWLRFKFCWGRWHYNTNAFGVIQTRRWVWELDTKKS